MHNITDNPKEFLAALPDFQKDLEDKYGDFLERLRAISPDIVKRHKDNTAIEFAHEDNLDELIEMFGDPKSE